MAANEFIETELAYREELRRLRDGQAALGRPVPLVPWWSRRTKRDRKTGSAEAGERKQS